MVVSAITAGHILNTYTQPQPHIRAGDQRHWCTGLAGFPRVPEKADPRVGEEDQEAATTQSLVSALPPTQSLFQPTSPSPPMSQPVGATPYTGPSPGHGPPKHGHYWGSAPWRASCREMRSLYSSSLALSDGGSGLPLPTTSQLTLIRL